MEIKEYLTNKNFCPIPWTGIMYNHDGEVKNCIRSTGKIGNIKDNTIEEIVNGPQNISNRIDMRTGTPCATCNTCYDLEKNERSFDVISDRIFYLKEMKHVDQTLYDSPTTFNLRKTDIRWTNLCNFACVYCFPRFSSKWASELNVRQEGPTDQQRDDFKDYIFKHTDQLNHVYLAGGEPLLMKENVELLERLLKTNPDVNLRINSNLSKTDTQVFDLVCKFKNVHWTVSVETIGDEFEYVRYGGKWEDFLDNLRKIHFIGHKISFNMLYFLLNYKSLFKCIEFFQDMGFHNNSFIIGGIITPEHLNVRNLPDTVLDELKQEFTKRINYGPGYLLENSYRNILAYLDEPWEKNLARSFDELAKLDQRRNLDSSQIFKELYALK